MTRINADEIRSVIKQEISAYQPEIEALLANGSTQKFIAKRYGTSEKLL